MQIILCPIYFHKKTVYGNSISFLFLFYDHSIEDPASTNLYRQLMTLRLLQWLSNIFHVLPLWNSMKLCWHYGIIWTSRFFIMGFYETRVCSQFYPLFCGYMFFLRVSRSASLDIMKSFSVDFLSRLYPNTCLTFLYNCFRHAQNFSMRALVSNSLVSCLQTRLYCSSGSKNGSWFYFLSVWISKREIIFSRVYIIFTLKCSNVWLI